MNDIAYHAVAQADCLPDALRARAILEDVIGVRDLYLTPRDCEAVVYGLTIRLPIPLRGNYRVVTDYDDLGTARERVLRTSLYQHGTQHVRVTMRDGTLVYVRGVMGYGDTVAYDAATHGAGLGYGYVDAQGAISDSRTDQELVWQPPADLAELSEGLAKALSNIGDFEGIPNAEPPESATISGCAGAV